MKKIVSAVLCIAILGSLCGAMAADSTGFNDIRAFSEGLAAAKIGRYWGYINEDGETVIPFVYREVFDFSEGLAVVCKDQYYGYIDQSGNEVIPMQYTEAEPFSEGYAVVENDGKMGAIDRTGKTVLPFQYDTLKNFSDGSALFVINESYNFIKPDGSWVYKGSRLNYAESFHDGLAYVEDSNGNHYFIDKNGNLAFKASYDWIGPFSDGYAVCLTGSKYGIINATGSNVTGGTYETAEDNGNGYILLYSGGYGGYFDKSNRQVTVTANYTAIMPPSEGLILAIKNNRYGFLDSNMSIAIKLDYAYAESFSEGFALIQKNDLYGFIDKTGKTTISCIYNEAESFCEGLAIVRSGRKYGCIDKNGNMVIPFEYGRIGGFVNGVSIAEKNGKYVLLKNPLLAKSFLSAIPGTAQLEINGVRVRAEAYNIGGNNYFKLRDLAYLLTDTGKRFSVQYDEKSRTITIKANRKYEAVGGELAFSGMKEARTAIPSDLTVYYGTAKLNIAAYNIGGYSYFMLRDLAKAVNFNVSWNNEQQIISIDTSKPYAEE